MDYKIPIIVFIVISVIMYFVSDTKEKDNKDTSFIIKKSVAPGMVAAIVAAIYVKYKDRFISNEKLMPGNYFD